MEVNIRPSTDLRNHHNEISKQCHETRKPIVITKNGRGDTVVMGLQDYRQLIAELELLRTLAEAHDDVEQGRVAPIKDTFDEIRKALLSREE